MNNKTCGCKCYPDNGEVYRMIDEIDDLDLYALDGAEGWEEAANKKICEALDKLYEKQEKERVKDYDTFVTFTYKGQDVLETAQEILDSLATNDYKVAELVDLFSGLGDFIDQQAV
jgi:hypothetical protein